MRIEKPGSSPQQTPRESASHIENLQPQNNFFQKTAGREIHSAEVNPEGIPNLRAIVSASIYLH